MYISIYMYITFVCVRLCACMHINNFPPPLAQTRCGIQLFNFILIFDRQTFHTSQ